MFWSLDLLKRSMISPYALFLPKAVSVAKRIVTGPPDPPSLAEQPVSAIVPVSEIAATVARRAGQRASFFVVILDSALRTVRVSRRAGVASQKRCCASLWHYFCL